MEIEPRLLDLRHAAAYLGASVWTVRDCVWAGELPSVRLGRKLFIDRADLDALIDRRKRFEGDSGQGLGQNRQRAKANA